jgi:glycosyltransferase involved in cell wall biosynthesis
MAIMRTSAEVEGYIAPTESAHGSAATKAPVILTLYFTYLPGYRAGGPIRSIQNLVASLGTELRFRIVTLDRDFGSKLPYSGVTGNQWIGVDLADVMYLRPGLGGLLRIYALLRSVDQNTILYLNSFFSRRFSMLAVAMRYLRLCRPRCVVLAPRGEFSTGALHFKRVRKCLYIRISRWLGLYNDIIWHASSHFESADIRRSFPLAKDVDVAADVPGAFVSGRTRATSAVVAASDIADIAQGQREARRKTPGRLRIAFVSRFTRMKNLSGALSMLEGLSGEVFFDIYGPAEDEAYWEECQALIATLPGNIRVRYCGEIEHERVRQVFADHDLFLFPTLGENYGHVIIEALTAGCPVLVSDQTPWRNLEAEGVGWDIPLIEPERFRSVLQQCVDGDGEWHAAISTRAIDYAARHTSDPDIVDANRRLFQRALAWPDPRCSKTDL